MKEYVSTLLWVIVVSVVTAQYLRLLISNVFSKKSPPGPIPLPIIGNFLSLLNRQSTYLSKLSNTYGPLACFWLGPRQVFIASTASLAKEILQRGDQAFSRRPGNDASRYHNEYSLLFGPVSTHWRNMRRLSYTHIFSGASLNARREMRTEKLKELVSYVQGCCKTNTAVDIGQASFYTALNIISNTCFSIDLVDLNSNSCHQLKQILSEMIQCVSDLNLADYFWVFKLLDPQGLGRRWSANFKKLQALTDKMIDAKQTTASCSELTNPDMLDSLLKFSQQNNDFDRSLITHLLVDLFLAGTDTNSLTVEWAMAEILRQPNILKKAQQELEQVVGKGNLVKETDIPKLPYLNAIIKETWRMHPLVPLFPRYVSSDAELAGFKLPKDSLLWVNILAISRDPIVWKNPDSFEPDRFFGSEIDIKGKNFEYLPFGSGHKMCPGLPLAVKVVPLMLSCFIHFFDWKLDGPAQNIDMRDEVFASLHKLKPLRIVPVIKN